MPNHTEIDREFEIIEKHTKAAMTELEKERAKSAEVKEAEQLVEEMQELNARLTNLSKEPSKNMAKINTTEARHTEVFKRLQELGVIKTDTQRPLI